MYNGWGDDHYTHVLTEEGLSGVDLHDDVGDVLTPVFSENGTHSSYLFSQRAIKIIRNHNQEQVYTIVKIQIMSCIIMQHLKCCNTFIISLESVTWYQIKIFLPPVNKY